MQQKPSSDDQRNLIFAVLMSLGVVLMWQVFYAGPEQERLRQQQAAEQLRQEQREQEQAERVAEAGPDQAATPFAGQLVDRQTALEETKTQRLAIDTPTLSGSLSLATGFFDDLILKDYNKTLAEDSGKVELLQPLYTANSYFAGFGWIAKGAGIKTPRGRELWALAPGSARGDLKPGSPIRLVWDNGEGLVFTREISVDERYMFTVTQSVENRGTAPVRLEAEGFVERHGRPQNVGIWILHEGPIGVVDGALKEVDYSDLREDPVIARDGSQGRRYEVEDRGWLGFTDKYWMTALAPVGPQPFTATYSLRSGRHGQPIYQARVLYPEKRVSTGETVSVTTRFFAGAKQMEALRDYKYLMDGNVEPTSFLGKLSDFFFYSGNSRFTDAVDWGWFAFLTRPIFEVLAGLYSLVGNMGVAIILLTLVIKLLLYPLAHKAFVSMAKMKKIQPEMKKIQEQYKDDRMAMQQEMMALYKKEKANPVAGCLPILIQIPIFFSLYKVLYVTIEMRHAPFFGWIQDLSAPDPTSIFNLFGLMPWGGLQDVFFISFLAIGIWPVLMGITMWIQQMLNPAPTDPMQAQIFAILPLLFTFLMGQFESGLVIYWTANNLFTILQQYAIMRSQGVDVDILGNMKRQLGLAPKEEAGS